MVQQIKAASIALEQALSRPEPRKDVPVVEPKQAAKPETTQTKKAVPSISEINARAFLQRQQIGAALYDRSFTFGEGIKALETQQGIATYAAKAQASNGVDAGEIGKIVQKQDKAEVQLQKLSTNGKGADLDSNAAIDGKDLDLVQEDLMNRINAGIKDGSLTEDEAKGLLARQEELNKLEVKLRESDSKLTAGEQKQVLDELRKEADKVQRLRHNDVGVNLTYKTYQDQIDARQASLLKQIEAGVKRGSLTQDEASEVMKSFDKAAGLESELNADGRVNWRDAVQMNTALNDVEIALYDLQRNKEGVQLKELYVDVKHADLRQAQQLESLARGISNKSLTDAEGIELLGQQQDIQKLENRYVKSGDGLDRGEFLRLQNSMNDFALRNQELQSNTDRWKGILTEPGKAPVANVPPPAPPVAPKPEPAAAAPSAPVPPAPAPVAPPAVAAEPPKPEAPKVVEPPMPEAGNGVALGQGERGASLPKINGEITKDKFSEMLTDTIGFLNKRVLEITNDMTKVEEQREETERNLGNDKRPPKVEAEDRVMTYDKVAKAVNAANEIVRKVA